MLLHSALRGARRGLWHVAGIHCRPAAPWLTAASRAPLAVRCCASRGGRPVRVTERSFSDLADLALLPLRHTIYSVNLWVLRLVFPGSWSADDFHTGAPQAFRHVTEHLEDRDARPLNGVVSDELIRELQQEVSAAVQGEREQQVIFKAVLDARLLGVFTVSARTDEHGAAAVFVTGLLGAVEEYASASSGTGVPWHVQRLHKWTFKRALPDEDGGEAGDWQVVAMSKRRWRPPLGLGGPGGA